MCDLVLGWPLEVSFGLCQSVDKVQHLLRYRVVYWTVGRCLVGYCGYKFFVLCMGLR